MSRQVPGDGGRVADQVAGGSYLSRWPLLPKL